jgi:hypothetical protein
VSGGIVFPRQNLVLPLVDSTCNPVFPVSMLAWTPEAGPSDVIAFLRALAVSIRAEKNDARTLWFEMSYERRPDIRHVTTNVRLQRAGEIPSFSKPGVNVPRFCRPSFRPKFLLRCFLARDSLASWGELSRR